MFLSAVMYICEEILPWDTSRKIVQTTCIILIQRLALILEQLLYVLISILLVNSCLSRRWTWQTLQNHILTSCSTSQLNLWQSILCTNCIVLYVACHHASQKYLIGTLNHDARRSGASSAHTNSRIAGFRSGEAAYNALIEAVLLLVGTGDRARLLYNRLRWNIPISSHIRSWL